MVGAEVPRKIYDFHLSASNLFVMMNVFEILLISQGSYIFVVL